MKLGDHGGRSPQLLRKRTREKFFNTYSVFLLALTANLIYPSDRVGVKASALEKEWSENCSKILRIAQFSLCR
jgi:hypothetical protein